mgnify:CR=1 FL=1
MHGSLFHLTLKYWRILNITIKAKTKIRYLNKKGFKTGIFGKEEINNIFTLFDLKKDGYISKAQTKEALKTLASSEL